jgi:protein-L-isoaspartate(D-aspartate) O-methyltransferase
MRSRIADLKSSFEGLPMTRHLHTVLSVLAAAIIFLVVVLWPSKIGSPPEPTDDLTLALAELGEEVQPASSTASAPVRPTASAPLAWHRPQFADRQPDRNRMVERQIAHPWDGRKAVTDPHVLAAMRNVPRHLFVEPDQRADAHADHPLPIGYGQTISQPYIVALMTEALKLRPGAKVLEIGTGSGYQAAILSELTPCVFTIEIVEPLAKRATERLAKLGYKTVQCKQGDGYFGWPGHAPFDGIIVTCAAGHVPPPLYHQLAPGGRMVIPIGQPGMYQQLKVVTKDPKSGQPRYQTICGVAFVPMVGRMQQ